MDRTRRHQIAAAGLALLALTGPAAAQDDVVDVGAIYTG
jgi:hypothetical protein